MLSDFAFVKEWFGGKPKITEPHQPTPPAASIDWKNDWLSAAYKNQYNAQKEQQAYMYAMQYANTWYAKYDPIHWYSTTQNENRVIFLETDDGERKFIEVPREFLELAIKFFPEEILDNSKELKEKYIKMLGGSKNFYQYSPMLMYEDYEWTLEK